MTPEDRERRDEAIAEAWDVERNVDGKKATCPAHNKARISLLHIIFWPVLFVVGFLTVFGGSGTGTSECSSRGGGRDRGGPDDFS